MQELILAIAGLILELLVFFCAGSLLTRILKMKAEVTMELGKAEYLFVSVDGDHGSLCTGSMSVCA